MSWGKLFLSIQLFAYTILAVRPKIETVAGGMHGERFKIEGKMSSCLWDSIALVH